MVKTERRTERIVRSREELGRLKARYGHPSRETLDRIRRDREREARECLNDGSR